MLKLKLKFFLACYYLIGLVSLLTEVSLSLAICTQIILWGDSGAGYAGYVQMCWDFYSWRLPLVGSDKPIIGGALWVVWEVNLGQSTPLGCSGMRHILSSVPLHHWVFQPLYAIHSPQGGLLQVVSACDTVSTTPKITLLLKTAASSLTGGSDGKQRHKPSATNFDWIDSGVPSMPLRLNC